MSLSLSSHKPRALAYAAGGLRGDYRLLEVDEALLAAIQAGDVVIKGAPEEEAVLCTPSKTFALKLVETTNLLLLLPQQEELDEEFAALPSMLTPDKDASGVRDIGLQTQLQKGAAAQDVPPLVATATVQSHLECVEIAPCLDKLPQLLGKPYGLEDEEAEQQQQEQAGGDAMEVDGTAAVAAAARPEGCHTTEELLQLVQASRAELAAELQRLQAVQLGPYWRLLDAAYLGSLLEMLVVSGVERGWDLREPIALQDAVEALQPEGYRPTIIQHCLQMFSTQEQLQPQQAAAAATPGGTPQQPAPQQGEPSSSSSHRLDGRKVCQHYARKLLLQRRVWPLSEFMAAWQQEVPDTSCWSPEQSMLTGEALLLLPDANEGAAEPRVRHFPAARLPGAPGPRFAALFAAQPRWTRDQLDPYLEGLRVPGQTVEMLLLKHARASQRSPTDPAVVFVSRY